MNQIPSESRPELLRRLSERSSRGGKSTPVTTAPWVRRLTEALQHVLGAGPRSSVITPGLQTGDEASALAAESSRDGTVLGAPGLSACSCHTSWSPAKIWVCWPPALQGSDRGLLGTLIGRFQRLCPLSKKPRVCPGLPAGA